MDCPTRRAPSFFSTDCPDLLDAEPLSLSSHGDAIDPFFANAQASVELERALADSHVDFDADLDFADVFREEEVSECSADAPRLVPVKSHGVCFDSEQVQENGMQRQNRSSCGNGILDIRSSGTISQDEEPQARHSGHHNNDVKRKFGTILAPPRKLARLMQGNSVEFDPLPISRDYDVDALMGAPLAPLPCFTAPGDRDSRPISPLHSLPPRQVSMSPTGLSRRAISESNVVAIPSPRGPPPKRRLTASPNSSAWGIGSVGSDEARPQEEVSADSQWHLTVVQNEKLVQSMRRTELSRRQLAMLGVPTLRHGASGALRAPGVGAPSATSELLRMYLCRIESC